MVQGLISRKASTPSQPQWLSRSINAKSGGPNDPWAQFSKNQAVAQRQASQTRAAQPMGQQVAQQMAQIDPQTRAQIIALLQARAAQMNGAAPARGNVQFDTTGGAAGFINRLNNMSQAEVNQLMAQPNFLNQFTPKNFGPLAGTGISSSLVRAAGNVNTIFDPAAQRAIDSRLGNVRRMGTMAQGMAAEQNIRNQVNNWYNKLNADHQYEAADRGLTAVEARTGIGRP
jgi:hypothetical protein